MIKGKVKYCQAPVTKHHAMKVHWENGDKASHILEFALDRGKWSASCGVCLTPM
jgi:hypothetical protein